MKLYRDVRSVLVRHFVDLGRLSVQISMTGVYLHGSLLRLPGVTSALTPEVVRVIMAELSRVPGVQRVNADFDNWQQDRAMGAWVEKKKEKRKEKEPAASPREPTPKVFEVEDDKQ